jgi:hypothetical protein
MVTLTPGRYRPQPGGDVYDSIGRYYISADLWRRRMEEGRSDRADHDFVLGERVIEDIPDQWHRVHAKCRTCGEEREVFFGVEMVMLNRGWCIARPWWRFW